jgi:hypothetical protein
MKTETIELRHLTAAEGKVLTDGSVYVHEVYLAPSEDPAKWHEIDAADVPAEPTPDEYANTEPEE